jgi:hypothetical protein
MVLIIDRGSTKRQFYSIQFGVDFDTLIFSETIYLKSLNKELISKIDRIVTKSVELKWCVMFIKHPLLLEHNNEKIIKGEEFDESVVRQTLREYFAVRLQHRRFPVELYDIGKRLFDN